MSGKDYTINDEIRQKLTDLNAKPCAKYILLQKKLWQYRIACFGNKTEYTYINANKFNVQLF